MTTESPVNTPAAPACPKCGKELVLGAPRCPWCGASLTARPTQRINPIVIAGAVILVLALGGGGFGLWQVNNSRVSASATATAAAVSATATADAKIEAYCGKQPVNDALVSMTKILSRWQDASELAGSTPRASLSGQIERLQGISDELSTTNVPPCLNKARSYLLTSMDQAIKGFMAFLAQEDDTTVSGLFASAKSNIGWYTEEVERVQACAPACQP